MKIIFVLAFLAWISFADYCGGNCPLGNCPMCTCGNTTNIVNVTDVCSKGTWNQTCCQCIINIGSGGDASYVGYETSSNSSVSFVGLFQINSLNWQMCNNGTAPCSVADNLKCANMSYTSGGGWKAWSTASLCGC